MTNKQIVAKLEELSALILSIGTSAKAEAQAPVSKKSTTSYWAKKPGITNSEAISELKSTEGAPLTVTIDDVVINGTVGKTYSNKAGTKCRALLIEDRGYATVRLTKAGRLPKAAKVYFVGNDEAVEVRFSA